VSRCDPIDYTLHDLSIARGRSLRTRVLFTGVESTAPLIRQRESTLDLEEWQRQTCAFGALQGSAWSEEPVAMAAEIRLFFLECEWIRSFNTTRWLTSELLPLGLLEIELDKGLGVGEFLPFWRQYRQIAC